MFKVSIAAALLTFALSAGAAPDRQVTLTTGEMVAPVGQGGYLLCTAVNVSAAPLEVKVELLSAQGDVVANNGSQTAVAPGRIMRVFSDYASIGYCRVTFQGTPSSVRAGICNWQNVSCVSNLEAR